MEAENCLSDVSHFVAIFLVFRGIRVDGGLGVATIPLLSLTASNN